MIKLLDRSRISFLDYFYLLCIIIYAGQASAFVREIGDIRTLGNAIPLILTIVFAFSKGVHIQKDFLVVVGVFSLYSLLVVVNTESSYYFFWGFSRWLIFLYMAYVICKGYGYRLFVITETILYHLAIIGVICWIVLLIIPGPFTRFISSIALTPFNDVEIFTSANALFYTIILSNVSGGLEPWYLLIRNSGFAWEPGAFACFMCLGICFNALRTNLRFKNNLALIVFLVALASTQSTTGYGTFAVMLIVWLVYNRKFFWLIILIPIIFLIMGLPFMAEKIMYKTEGFAETSLANAGFGGMFDRVLSFRILWDEFLRHPLLGYGFAEPEHERFGLQIWSGIGRLLAQYGIILSVLFVIVLVKTSRFICYYFSTNAGLLLIIAILGSMVSYMIWSFPFCIAIWIFGLFSEQTRCVDISQSSY